jgi:hypothetical protein
MSDELDEFCGRVAVAVSSGRTAIIGRARLREITELVVLHWPARHLQSVAMHGQKHAAVNHAIRLCRAQVREHHEARHGMGVLWETILATVCLHVCSYMVEQWFQESHERRLYARLALELAKRERQS